MLNRPLFIYHQAIYKQIMMEADAWKHIVLRQFYIIFRYAFFNWNDKNNMSNLIVWFWNNKTQFVFRYFCFIYFAMSRTYKTPISSSKMFKQHVLETEINTFNHPQHSPVFVFISQFLNFTHETPHLTTSTLYHHINSSHTLLFFYRHRRQAYKASFLQLLWNLQSFISFTNSNLQSFISFTISNLQSCMSSPYQNLQSLPLKQTNIWEATNVKK